MIRKFLFSLLVVGFLTGEIARYTFYSHVSVRFFDVINGLIFIVFCLEYIRSEKKRKIVHSDSSKALGVFLVISLTSLLYNSLFYPFSDILEASLYLIRYIVYGSIYFYFYPFSEAELPFVRRMLTLIGMGIVSLGFVQYIFYNNLRNLYYLGWDDHMYRLFSVFLDPNFTGVLLALYSIYLLGEIVRRKNDTNMIAYGYCFILAITIIATVMTYSRSALISLVIGCFVFLTLLGKRRYFGYLIAFVLGVIVLSLPFFYLENVNLFRSASSKARIESVGSALKIIQHNWIVGVGFNNYRAAQIHYGIRSGEGAVVSHADSGTDNSYLFVLATTGIVGLLSYLYFLKTLFMRGIQTLSGEKKVAAAVFIASLCSVMVSSLFLNSLFYPFIIVWLWILLCFIN